jgi:hypothetical protein
VHEALIRNWPTLVDWVKHDRAFQSWLRQLKPRVEDWRAHPADEGTLLRGGPLAVAEDWVTRRGDELSEKEKAFITASLRVGNAEIWRIYGTLAIFAATAVFFPTLSVLSGIYPWTGETFIVPTIVILTMIEVLSAMVGFTLSFLVSYTAEFFLRTILLILFSAACASALFVIVYYQLHDGIVGFSFYRYASIIFLSTVMTSIFLIISYTENRARLLTTILIVILIAGFTVRELRVPNSLNFTIVGNVQPSVCGLEDCGRTIVILSMAWLFVLSSSGGLVGVASAALLKRWPAIKRT